ncbi:MAG: HEAT repeat domain-containing protein [candidate division Zixibacteria bacterium]|nr:HEAT repeat domain-containing protein [candidate division Zixibacteria bacterium]
MNEIMYTEADLTTNLNELAHEMLRELYIAAKKASIYSVDHPLTRKAIGRPFLLMEKIFRFKKHVNLHIASGHLYALNIKTKPSIFTDQIMDYMQVLDVGNILFSAGMTADELGLFLARFVKRLRSGDYQNLLTTYITNQNIATITVNDEAGYLLFERGRKFPSEVIRDFSVRGIITDILPNDYEDLAELVSVSQDNHGDYIARYCHDYYPQLVAFLVPEKIGRIPADDIVALISQRLEKAESDDGESCRRLIAALHYHPDHDNIIRRLDEIALSHGIDRSSYTSIMPAASKIRITAVENIDRYLDGFFNQLLSFQHVGEFTDHFGRLLRTGQQAKAQVVIDRLLHYLAGNNLDLRQRALALLKIAVGSCLNLTGTSLLEYLTEKICTFLDSHEETFEFSDLIWEIVRSCLSQNILTIPATLGRALSAHRQLAEGIWCYESIAVKKAVEEMNRSEIISGLVNHLINGDHQHIQDLRDIMVAIGSEEMAFALSEVISHESRHVRQQVLKILPEMGKSSLNVLSRFMANEKNFARDESRRELPDTLWYQVRNAIFVLGALQDFDACRVLRQHITDSDTRVRRAIVSALEKIGGEEAADLLLVMVNDDDAEIRESALISLGIVGSAEIVPELIDLARKRRGEIIRIITALGILGGNDAKVYLAKLLTDHDMLSELTSGRSSREELKMATLKALGRIGDREAIQTIKDFSESISASQKLFFGGSKLSKTAEEILSRQSK